MAQKDSVRSKWQKRLAAMTTGLDWGKAAEKLRSLQSYREAQTVFATPHESLHQVRINCLTDGKNLLMPGPGIRDGFFLLVARSVPFKDIFMAVTYKGLEKYGQHLKSGSLSKLSLELLLTDGLAIDRTGGRLGDGTGYFDLCCAILQEFKGIEQNAAYWVIVAEEQISTEPLPQDRWDINMNGVITPGQIIHFGTPTQKPQIFWDMISLDRIRRIGPLWKLFEERGKG